MYLNQFSVRIVGGKEVAGGYVEMQHGKKYRLSLRNNRAEPCDARVEIDGKHVGTWRIPGHGRISLERPASEQKHFTFYKLGTDEARQAEIDSDAPELGLVKVTFSPEKRQDIRPLKVEPGPYKPWIPNKPWHPYKLWPYDPQPQWEATSNVECSMETTRDAYMSFGGGGYCNAAHNAGGTGLSGESSQQYGTTYAIEYDLSQQTTIHLRLVCVDKSDIIPLTTQASPVPPRV